MTTRTENRSLLRFVTLISALCLLWAIAGAPVVIAWLTALAIAAVALARLAQR